METVKMYLLAVKQKLQLQKIIHRRLEEKKIIKRNIFFKCGRNCSLNNCSLGSLVPVPRKIMEKIAFKKQQKLFEVQKI